MQLLVIRLNYYLREIIYSIKYRKYVMELCYGMKSQYFFAEFQSISTKMIH